MKTIATSTLLLGVILITGCVSNQPRVQYSLYQPIAGEITSKKIQAKLSNGVLMVHGKRVLDEEGDINSVYTINDQVYYFLSKQTPSRESSITFILKTLDGQKIKEFEGQAIRVTPSSEHLPLILVKLSGSGNFYDNIYSFDGDKVSLINKNVPVYKTSVISSNFVFTPKYRRDRYDNDIRFEGNSIVDITTGETINIQIKRAPNLFLGKEMSMLTIIGAAGDNIIYFYKDINGDSVIEAQNVYTKEKYSLVEGTSTIQFLSGNGHVVLRIFKNSTFIDLKTLKKVSINLSDYEPIVLRGGFDNLAGSYTPRDYTTYAPYEIKSVIHGSKRIFNGHLVIGRILF